MGGLGRVSEGLGGVLVGTWRRSWAILEGLGEVLGRLGELLEGSWEGLGGFWGGLGEAGQVSGGLGGVFREFWRLLKNDGFMV